MKRREESAAELLTFQGFTNNRVHRLHLPFFKVGFWVLSGTRILLERQTLERSLLFRYLLEDSSTLEIEEGHSSLLFTFFCFGSLASSIAPHSDFRGSCVLIWRCFEFESDGKKGYGRNGRKDVGEKVPDVGGQYPYKITSWRWII